MMPREANRSASFAAFRSTSTEASNRMKKNKAQGGLAESLLRAQLRRRGLRFDVRPRTLPGKPDIVFRRERLCVFCDGDFWHGRRWQVLRNQLAMGENAEYWTAKIASNRRRDRAQGRALRKLGWRVVRLWETDVLSRPEGAVGKVVRALEIY